MKIGFVVNPIAGMGGRVGLKGTDGKAEKAHRLGANPQSPQRAMEALESLRDIDEAVILTYGGNMGEDIARATGHEPNIAGEPANQETTAQDTRDAVQSFVEHGAGLIVFVGGDGTAADVADALQGADSETPVIGVPAGVKIHSSVFLEYPRDLGKAVEDYIQKGETKQGDVNDVDEEAFRQGEVRTKLHSVLNVPDTGEIQHSKQSMQGDVEGVISGFVDDVEQGVTYVLGPGGTLKDVKKALGFNGTALGVDVWRDGDVIELDAGEEEILSALSARNTVVVSPIGGQGFIFGRGNQQISPSVIKRSDVMVLASRDKLRGLDALHVDTGDDEADEELRGWIRVRVGRNEWRVMKVW